jgi:hypothetical protein
MFRASGPRRRQSILAKAPGLFRGLEIALTDVISRYKVRGHAAVRERMLHDEVGA